VAYYSSEIFIEAKMPHMVALGTSLGFGFINFAFALPAFFLIDSYGRRPLLLATIPCMAVFLVATAGSFWAPEGPTRIAAIATSIYLFGISYSSGAGPVPFTYSAEAYPLHLRALGMSVATATAWFFNATLALTWPPLMNAITPQGAFGFYAATNMVAFVLVFLFVPETKNKSLEELDGVFDVSATSMVGEARASAAESMRVAADQVLRRRKNASAAAAPEQQRRQQQQGSASPTAVNNNAGIIDNHGEGPAAIEMMHVEPKTSSTSSSGMGGGPHGRSAV
jgi:MFS family permease